MTTLDKIISIYVIVTFSSHANWTCKQGKLRFIEFRKSKELSSEYCYNDKKDALISKNCLEKECIKRELSKRTIPKVHVTPVGSPMFKLCTSLEGSPQIIEFYADSRWWKLDRCIFSNPQNYSDTGYLYGQYMKGLKELKKNKKKPKNPFL